MILITTGSTKYPFTRLERIARKIDKLLHQEKIIYQGIILHEHKYSKYFKHTPLMSSEEFISLVKSSRIIITHAGYGSIMNILHFSKNKPLVFPRLKKHHEHVNNHQRNFARYMENLGLIEILSSDKIISKTYLKNFSKINTASKYLDDLKKRKNSLISYLSSISNI